MLKVEHEVWSGERMDFRVRAIGQVAAGSVQVGENDFIGGLVVSSLLGFRYAEGFNLPSIVVATLGAVILLAVFGGFQGRRTS